MKLIFSLPMCIRMSPERSHVMYLLFIVNVLKALFVIVTLDAIYVQSFDKLMLYIHKN